MKVIPQYKVIGPYNYDRIIHNIEKNYAKRQDGSTFLLSAQLQTNFHNTYILSKVFEPLVSVGLGRFM